MQFKVATYPSSRADYWKSHAKKFCDFCKCWIADNKPSIGYHESGKRHKENVAKRLSEISKNSAKSHMDSMQVDREMKKMEEDALKAYMKDLQENPDLTSKRIIEETEKRKKELEDSVKRKKEVGEEKEPAGQEPESSASTSASKVWYEAKSDEGYTYYWNVNTAESLWEPPEEGFFSIEEQEKQEKELQIKEEMKRRKKEEKAKIKQEEREKKKRKMNESVELVSSVAGPAPKPEPYGQWATIEPKVEEPLDLQLPVQEYVAIKVTEITEPEIKFKEKTIQSLDECGDMPGTIKQEVDASSISFKKRKVNRGNMRQKLDTD